MCSTEVGEGSRRRIRVWVTCLAVFPQHVWTSDVVPTDHAQAPSGLHLSLSGSSALCALSVSYSWAQHRHAAVSPPLQGMGTPLGHTGDFCCSWELYEATSGPPAWACPLDDVHSTPLQYLWQPEEVQAPPTSWAAPGAQGLTVLGPPNPTGDSILSSLFP